MAFTILLNPRSPEPISLTRSPEGGGRYGPQAYLEFYGT
jgi:hypothetical protein